MVSPMVQMRKQCHRRSHHPPPATATREQGKDVNTEDQNMLAAGGKPIHETETKLGAVAPINNPSTGEVEENLEWGGGAAAWATQ